MVRQKNAAGLKITRRSDGRYYFSYKMGSTRREISNADYDTLRRRAEKIARQLAMSDGTADPRTRFIDYLDEYNHMYHYIKLRKSTIMRYEFDMKNIVTDPVMGSILLIDVTPAILQDYYNRLATAKSASVVRQAHKLIAPSLRHAAIVGLVRRDAAALVCIPTDDDQTQLKRAQRAEHKALTRNEQGQLLAYCLTHYNQQKSSNLLIAFMLATGCRVSEAIALTWDDIDYQAQTAHITKQWHTDEQALTLPKTRGGIRYVPLPGYMIDALKRLKPMQRARMDIMMEKQRGDTPIFSSDIGTHKDRRNVNKTLKRICRKIGIPPHSVHDLRHTFVTSCIDAGLPPTQVQKWLGDDDLKTVMSVYAHWSASARADAAQKKFLYDLENLTKVTKGESTETEQKVQKNSSLSEKCSNPFFRKSR